MSGGVSAFAPSQSTSTRSDHGRRPLHSQAVYITPGQGIIHTDKFCEPLHSQDVYSTPGPGVIHTDNWRSPCSGAIAEPALRPRPLSHAASQKDTAHP